MQWSETRGQDPLPTGPRYLRLYKESHFRALGDRFERGVTQPEFLQRLAQTRVLYLGDHHANRSLHQTMLALLDDIDRAGQRYHLALECIGTEDEAVVDRFLAGQLDIEALANALEERWPDTWLRRGSVDSAFYRALLIRAKRHGHPVFALEPTPRLPLYQRDQAMARTLLQRARAHADALLVVIVGETHLLGHGQLVQRVALPNLAVCASLSVSLREHAARQTFSPLHRFAQTNADVLFSLPLDDARAD